MGRDWILDVLNDIRNFAKQNAMPELADHLDETILAAASEISRHAQQHQEGSLPSHATQVQQLYRPTSVRNDA